MGGAPVAPATGFSSIGAAGSTNANTIATTTSSASASAAAAAASAIHRVRRIEVEGTRFTINIRSADPTDGFGAGDDDLHSLRFLLFLPLDMPNIDVKLNPVRLLRKVGTKSDIWSSLTAAVGSEVFYEAGLAFTTSYLLTVFKGIYSGAQWMVRAPYDHVLLAEKMHSERLRKLSQLQGELGMLPGRRRADAILEELNQSGTHGSGAVTQQIQKISNLYMRVSWFLFHGFPGWWVVPLIHGLSEGLYRAFAEILGHLLIFILFWCNLIHRPVIGTSRERAHSVLDGLSLGIRGLFRDTLMTPWIRAIEVTRLTLHDYGKLHGIGAGLFFACVTVPLGPLWGVLHFVASFCEGTSMVLLQEEAQFAVFEPQRNLNWHLIDDEGMVGGAGGLGGLGSGAGDASPTNDEVLNLPDGPMSSPVGGEEVVNVNVDMRPFPAPPNSNTESVAN